MVSSMAGGQVGDGADGGSSGLAGGDDTVCRPVAPVAVGGPSWCSSTSSQSTMGGGFGRTAESTFSGMLSEGIADGERHAKRIGEVSVEPGEEGEERLDLPGSWVEKLEIPFDRYELRYPEGVKILLYKDCKVVRT